MVGVLINDGLISSHGGKPVFGYVCAYWEEENDSKKFTEDENIFLL